MKVAVYFVLTVLIISSGCQKGKTIAINDVPNDSIAKYLAYATVDSLSPQKRLEYNTRAFDILQHRENDSVTLRLITNSAILFYQNNDLQSFKSFSALLNNKANIIKDSAYVAKSYRFYYEYYKKFGQNDSALYFVLKAEKYYKGIGSDSEIGTVLLDKGRIQYLEDDYFGAEISIMKAYSFFSKVDDKQKLFECLSIIGTIANDLKDYDRALDFHTRAYRYAKNNNFIQLAIPLNNIGNVYQNINQHNKAILYFKEALRSERDLKATSPELYAILLDNLGYSYLQLSNYDQLPYLFTESLAIRDSLRLDYSVIFSKIHLSQFYAKQNDSITSLNLATEAYNFATILKSPTSIIATLQHLTTLNPKMAGLYSPEYIAINDSLRAMERKSKDKFARIQFETDEITIQKDLLEEQNRNLFSFFIGTIMIILLLFVIRTQRAKNRELLLRQAQQKANEEIYNLMLAQQNTMEEGRIQEKRKIAQELHDGVLGRLFGARLNLDSLNKSDGDEAEAKRNNYLTELKNIEQDIREISHDLNREKSAVINNFVAIFTNLLDEQELSHPAKVSYTISDDIRWEKINNNLKINIYRITQEALQNINKYAKAKSIIITVSDSPEFIKLIIKDDGVGFDTVKKSKGIGLQNITSRAFQCGGTAKINSKKGEGTSITITFPRKNTDNSTQRSKTNHHHKSNKKWQPA